MKLDECVRISILCHSSKMNGWIFTYRVFIKYCVFFLNSASSAAALVFYLPGVCTHTDTKGKKRRARVRNILKSSEKNTQYLMNTLYINLLCDASRTGCSQPQNRNLQGVAKLLIDPLTFSGKNPPTFRYPPLRKAPA